MHERVIGKLYRSIDSLMPLAIVPTGLHAQAAGHIQSQCMGALRRSWNRQSATVKPMKKLLFLCGICLALVTNPVAAFASPWPRLDAGRQRECTEALKIANSVFRSGSFHLCDSPQIPGNVTSTLVLSPGIPHSLLVCAQDIPKGQIPARTELHSFQSLTISDAAFLKGEDKGTPVTLAGELRVAQGVGRMPVVVLVHGSSGIGSNTDVWARQFNQMGVSAFILDSFTGRGLTLVGPDQSQLGRLNLSLDAYRALEVLAKHPRVDPKRIVLMGFSRGGQATL